MVEKASPTRRISSIRAFTSSFSFSCFRGFDSLPWYQISIYLSVGRTWKQSAFSCFLLFILAKLVFPKDEFAWHIPSFSEFSNSAAMATKTTWRSRTPSFGSSIIWGKKSLEKLAIILCQVHLIIQSHRRLNCLAPRTRGTRRSTLTKQVLLLQMSSRKYL